MLSPERAEVTDIRQSAEYTKFMNLLGWSSDTIGQITILSKKVPLLGTLIRIERPNLPLPLEEIEILAKEKRAAIVKVEPNLITERFRPQLMGPFRKDSNPILPTRSIWIDLTVSEDKLLTNLEKDTRNLVRRAEKEGVEVVESKDLGSFYEIWSANAKKKGFYTPFEKEMNNLWKSFSEKRILVAKYHNSPVAAAMILGYKEAAYYYFAASSEQGRQVFASYKLVWESIVRSKRWGYSRLDLEGIADPKVGRTKKWQGFSHFKKGFGGREVQYIGSFSKSYSLLGRIFSRFI